MSEFLIEAELDNPILFRTMSSDVYNCTVNEGSIWLRSSEYYQKIEDQARNDDSEGINSAKLIIPLNFKPLRGNRITIQGNGTVGQAIVPHYIVSLHSSSISAREHQNFGGCTVGIKNFSSLAAEVLFRVSKKIDVSGYRFGQVAYQHTSLVQSNSGQGAAMNLGGEPCVYLKSINTDVLRKAPIQPFIEQDEWRIVIFTKGYYKNDPMAALDIFVDPAHFYEYLPPIK